MSSDRAGVPGIDYLDDNATEAIASHPSMDNPCRACPAVQGSEASRHPITSELFGQCIEARHAFWCHLTRQGGFATHLCGGWRRALDARQPATLSGIRMKGQCRV